MKSFVLGLDIGGSKISGVVAASGKIVRELTIVTPKSLKDFKHSLEKLADFLVRDDSISRVGIGVAGVVNADRGVVQSSPNLKYLKNFNFKTLFRSFGFTEVQVENDARCFALAEGAYGKGKGLKDFVGLTLGTGIGGGLVLQGKMYRGAHSSAGEVGHMVADSYRDLEHYYQKARDRKNYMELGNVVGIVFANLINTLDAEAVILGGSVTKSHAKKFMPQALATAKRHIINKSIKPRILLSTLRSPGALGATLLVS